MLTCQTLRNQALARELHLARRTERQLRAGHDEAEKIFLEILRDWRQLGGAVSVAFSTNQFRKLEGLGDRAYSRSAAIAKSAAFAAALHGTRDPYVGGTQ